VDATSSGCRGVAAAPTLVPLCPRSPAALVCLFFLFLISSAPSNFAAGCILPFPSASPAMPPQQSEPEFDSADFARLLHQNSQ
jgi:hypothetical protein